METTDGDYVDTRITVEVEGVDYEVEEFVVDLPGEVNYTSADKILAAIQNRSARDVRFGGMLSEAQIIPGSARILRAGRVQ